MRSGVPSRPSRSGSSPAQRINVRTASSASFRVGRRERDSGAEMGGAIICDINFPLGCWAVSAPEPDGSRRRSVEPNRLMRAVEREGWDPNPEALAAPRLHLVAADHDAGWGRQRGAAGIFEALARPENRLL